MSNLILVISPSYVGSEGDVLEMVVIRSRGVVGVVTVDWQIKAKGDFSPQKGFRDVGGTFIMNEVCV